MLCHPQIPPLELGDFKLHAFDVCVAAAVVAGVLTAERRAERIGLDRRVVMDMTLWAVLPGFVAAHLYSLFFYFPERIAENPWVILDLFAGMSSFGGFVGGALGVMAFFRLRKISIWPYSNAVMYGFTLAWVFGRLGCTLAFDHPGVLTDFALAMPYPGSDKLPAGPRHNLGFYELIWALGLFAFFFATRKKPRFAGWHLVIFVLTYVPVRFAFDFLREVDLRYAGLTPGQWAAIGVFAVGLWWLRVLPRRGEVVHADGRVHTFPDGRPGRPEAAPPPG